MPKCLTMPPREKWDRIMFLSGLVSFALAALIITYYAITFPTERTFGERYVIPQIPLIFPFYLITSFKPVTLITYLVFAGVMLILEGTKGWLTKIDTRGTRILLLLLAFASGYEVIWNLFAWFATWQRNGGLLDLLANTHHEYAALPANFNFATKISFLIFIISLYSSFFLEKLERDRNRNYPK